jgi:cytochrome P450
MKLVKRDI